MAVISSPIKEEEKPPVAPAQQQQAQPQPKFSNLATFIKANRPATQKFVQNVESRLGQQAQKSLQNLQKQQQQQLVSAQKQQQDYLSNLQSQQQSFIQGTQQAYQKAGEQAQEQAKSISQLTQQQAQSAQKQAQDTQNKLNQFRNVLQKDPLTLTQEEKGLYQEALQYKFNPSQSSLSQGQITANVSLPEYQAPEQFALQQSQPLSAQQQINRIQQMTSQPERFNVLRSMFKGGSGLDAKLLRGADLSGLSKLGREAAAQASQATTQLSEQQAALEQEAQKQAAQSQEQALQTISQEQAKLQQQREQLKRQLAEEAGGIEKSILGEQLGAVAEESEKVREDANRLLTERLESLNESLSKRLSDKTSSLQSEENKIIQALTSGQLNEDVAKKLGLTDDIALFGNVDLSKYYKGQEIGDAASLMTPEERASMKVLAELRGIELPEIQQKQLQARKFDVESLKKDMAPLQAKYQDSIKEFENLESLKQQISDNINLGEEGINNNFKNLKSSIEDIVSKQKEFGKRSLIGKEQAALQFNNQIPDEIRNMGFEFNPTTGKIDGVKKAQQIKQDINVRNSKLQQDRLAVATQLQQLSPSSAEYALNLKKLTNIDSELKSAKQLDDVRLSKAEGLEKGDFNIKQSSVAGQSFSFYDPSGKQKQFFDSVKDAGNSIDKFLTTVPYSGPKIDAAKKHMDKLKNEAASINYSIAQNEQKINNSKKRLSEILKEKYQMTVSPENAFKYVQNNPGFMDENKNIKTHMDSINNNQQNVDKLKAQPIPDWKTAEQNYYNTLGTLSQPDLDKLEQLLEQEDTQKRNLQAYLDEVIIGPKINIPLRNPNERIVSNIQRPGENFNSIVGSIGHMVRR